MNMYWCIKCFWRFVSHIPSCARDTWEVSGWSSYSRGRFLDQIEALVMQWNDLITACSLHRRARRYEKRKMSKRQKIS